ncbi:hypothetical protein SSBR45G_31720 [Bradyrhizobium sp. SSBR45G]|uniref:hypothetical protein n=1 Tax=unclassified Bradyrhizobium TaxID=2631580 RepID=UPI002342A777|nr:MULTISPECIES: hypothetical protein [unclassified Bradyrhizobium]GLH78263.1 hypothetical protein SSBR45G_31720 [Bradyrhizobium sp. SSBR45G]GLH85970.1 hypothetical protein SSBR45R_34300 [Bradyrhizobium sp. SSBR45R]
MTPSQEISKRISESLSEDGFRQPSRGIHVKSWSDAWRGWIGIDSGRYSLGPVVGLFNDEFLKTSSEALKRLGAPWRYGKSGPPLIMINLQQLAEQDADSRERISWTYRGEALEPSVADDIVHCIRTCGYPYIQAHTNIEALWHAAVEEKRASHAFIMYLPILLIRLGRLDALRQVVDVHRERPVSADLSISYKHYVDALLSLHDGGLT